MVVPGIILRDQPLIWFMRLDEARDGEHFAHAVGAFVK